MPKGVGLLREELLNTANTAVKQCHVMRGERSKNGDGKCQNNGFDIFSHESIDSLEPKE